MNPAASYHPLEDTPDAASGPMTSALRRELWVLSRSRNFILVSLATSLCLAAAYNYGSRPLYQATSVISLDETGVSALRARGAVDQARLTAALQDQVRILESKELALVVVNNATPDVAAELARGPLGDWQERIEEELRLRIGSANVHDASPPALVDSLRSRLVIQYEAPATWVYVRLTGYDPAATATAVNHLVDAYLAETEKQTAGALGASRQRLEEKVLQSKERVVETLGKLQTLDDKTGLQNVENRTALLQKELSRLQDSLISVRQNAISRRALLDEVQRVSLADMASIPPVREDGEVAECLRSMSEFESRIAGSAATLGEKHPEILGLRAELDLVKKRLNARLLAIRDARARDFRMASREEQDTIVAIGSAQRELNTLDRNSIERSFIQKQAEAGQRAAGELIARSVREADEEVFFTPSVLQRAETPAIPASPQRARNFEYAFVIGLIGGLALAWLRSHLDETVKTPDDVKAHFAVPLLGMVPRVPSDEVDLFRVHEGPANPLFEAYRVLRTNLTLGEHAAKKNQLILMTSSREGEGKTTTSSGLAVALARSGHRVLLLDGDVRRASLSRLLSSEDLPGLTEAIEGAAPAACIVPTRVKGLSLMPSGASRPDAAEVLNRESLSDLIDSLRADYDWIICDAPPVLAVADAAIMCRFADIVLVVVGANMTPLGSIRATLEQLSAVSGRVRGLILNNVDLTRDSHYYRHYYSARYYADYSTGKRLGAKGMAARTAAKALPREIPSRQPLKFPR